MDDSPAVFFSYARSDDIAENGRLSDLRKALEIELRTLSGDDWTVFQDVEDIAIGEQWRKRLSEGITGSTFFLPILTPTYLKRPICREELSQFLEREKELGRDDLVVPLLYLDTPPLANADLQKLDPLATALAARKWDDWRELRIYALRTAKVRQRLSGLAKVMLSARERRVPALTPPPLDTEKLTPSIPTSLTNSRITSDDAIEISAGQKQVVSDAGLSQENDAAQKLAAEEEVPSWTRKEKVTPSSLTIVLRRFAQVIRTLAALRLRINHVWLVAISLLIAIALVAWLGGLYVFNQPERPFSYWILQKLHKIQPSKRFDRETMPAGEFLNADQLHDRYAAMSPAELAKENSELMRNYVRNYQKVSDRVTYVVGRYSIREARELRSTDICNPGFVALTNAVGNDELLMEHIYPADTQTVPALKQTLAVGLEIKLEPTHDLSAVIHAERLADGHILITAMPLLYGTYSVTKGTETFGLEPPVRINVAADWPLFQQRVEKH